MIKTEPKYSIGTQFKTRGKHPEICTVTDVLRTYNSNDELVKVSYQAEHIFMGQTVVEYDLPEATIARGLLIPNTK